MSLVLRIFIILAGFVLEGIVVRDLAKHRMTEKQYLFWLFSGIILMIAGLFPDLTFVLANFFGVEYAPSMVFAMGLLLAIYGIYRCFATNAVLMRQMTEMVEQVSLLKHELNELQKKVDERNQK